MSRTQGVAPTLRTQSQAFRVRADDLGFAQRCDLLRRVAELHLFAYEPQSAPISERDHKECGWKHGGGLESSTDVAKATGGSF